MFPQCQLFLSSKSPWFKILDPRARWENLLCPTQCPGPALWGSPCTASFFLQVGSLLCLHTRPTTALTAGWAARLGQEYPGHITPPQGLCPTSKAPRLSPSSALEKWPSWPCSIMYVLHWVQASWRPWPAGHVPISFINQEHQNIFP